MARTDYRKYSKKTVPVDEPVEEYTAKIEEPVEEVAPQPKPVIGVVSGCSKLNIRKNPSPDSEILCAVNEGSKLLIDETTSTLEWYAVCTEAGFDGFCMKAYVTAE